MLASDFNTRQAAFFIVFAAFTPDRPTYPAQVTRPITFGASIAY